MSGARAPWLAVGAAALAIGVAGYALLRLSADMLGAYGVDHSGQVYVIDAEGRLRLYIRSHDAAPEAIAHDLRLLIEQGAA